MAVPASVPSLSSGSTSPSSPASLPSPSLLIHLLIITVLTFSSGWSILMTVVQVSSSLSRSMTLEGHAKTFHCPVWPAWSVGLLQFILTLLEPVWMVSPVWCHPPASITWFHSSPSFLFWRTLVLLPYFCCSALVPPSSGSVCGDLPENADTPQLHLQSHWEHPWGRTQDAKIINNKIN